MGKRAAGSKKTTVRDFAAYARQFSVEVQDTLSRIRSTIKQAVPEATETISYNMPAFKLHDRIIVYFAAFKAHIGLYPPLRGPAALQRAAAPYAGPKGNLQFPYAEPIPYDLIARIARSRAAEANAGLNRDVRTVQNS
jgi:uncharacterized protein YdhG (YjbR/CyaY superfamily)